MLSDFQAGAVAVAIKNMFDKEWFDYQIFQELCKMLDKKDIEANDTRALHMMHCVSWTDMGHNVAHMTRQKIIEILGLPPTVLDDLTRVVPDPAPTEPPKRSIISLITRR